jgi:hypothetical protein
MGLLFKADPAKSFVRLSLASWPAFPDFPEGMFRASKQDSQGENSDTSRRKAQSRYSTRSIGAGGIRTLEAGFADLTV